MTSNIQDKAESQKEKVFVPALRLETVAIDFWNGSDKRIYCAILNLYKRTYCGIV